MPGVQYGRVGGMQYEYLGDRTFRGTINIIYESEGKILSFIPKIVQADDVSYRFCELSTGGDLSMVIPFEQCIARPETDGKEFPLTDHLEAVAWKMGSYW